MSDRANAETELKVQLSDAAAWQKVCQRLGSPQAQIVQRNRFYDTPGRALRRAALALRVRREGEEAVVTVKGPKQRLGDAVHRFELEHRLSPAERVALQRPDWWRLDIPPLRLVRDRVEIDTLIEVARFENLRSTFLVQLAGAARPVEVDRTTFADGSVDHEIEVELPDRAEVVAAVAADLRALLAELGVPYTLQPRGKLARALSRGTKT